MALTYTLTNSNTQITITGSSPAATGALVIPNTIVDGTYGELPVTSIGYQAFYLNVNITSLTLGSNLITLGESTFSGCSGLTGSLTIGNGVTHIGGSAFYGCSGFTGSLTIPDSVLTIGGFAFYGCTGFTGSLTIGNGVNDISNSAFYGCTGFKGSLTIGNEVSTINGSVFYGCTGFTGSLTIPDSVTEIGQAAFGNCTGFTGSLIIGNGVTNISHAAFRGCTGFTGSLTIPDSVTYLGFDVFNNCTGFTGSLTIPDSILTLEDGAFNNCTGFTGSLTIPDSVTTLGERAFRNCSGFNGLLTIGSGVTSIGDFGFADDSGFTSVWWKPIYPPTIGGLGFIGVASGYRLEGTDSSYDTLKDSINVPIVVVLVTDSSSSSDSSDSSDSSVSSQSSQSSQSSSMSSRSSRSSKSSNSSSHSSRSSQSSSSSLSSQSSSSMSSSSVSSLSSRSNSSASSESSYQYQFTYILTHGNTEVTITGTEAYPPASGAMIIPDTLTVPIYGTLPVTAIGNGAFEELTDITSLQLSSYLETIGDSAFLLCSGLSGTLVIPSTVTSIGVGAFQGCVNLDGVWWKPINPPTTGEDAFDGVEPGFRIAGTSSTYGSFEDAGDNPIVVVYVPLTESDPGVVANGTAYGILNLLTGTLGAVVLTSGETGLSFALKQVIAALNVQLLNPWLDLAPAGTAYPLCVVSPISDVTDYTLGRNGCRIENHRIQITMYATSTGAAGTIEQGKRVDLAMEGLVVAANADGFGICGIHRESSVGPRWTASTQTWMYSKDYRVKVIVPTLLAGSLN